MVRGCVVDIKEVVAFIILMHFIRLLFYFIWKQEGNTRIIFSINIGLKHRGFVEPCRSKHSGVPEARPEDTPRQEKCSQ